MPTEPGPLTAYRRAAMASDFEVLLNATRDDRGADAALDALDEVDRIENVLSIFRPTTLASRVNLLASEMNVRVDEEFWGWLRTSLRFAAETDGAFDVASAPLWRAWGFAKRDGEFPPPDVLKDALDKSGSRRLILNDEERTIAFDRPGVELNFGAIGKGIALDAAAKKLEDAGVGSFLIQGGKSGVVARGSRNGDVWFVGENGEDGGDFNGGSTGGGTANGARGGSGSRGGSGALDGGSDADSDADSEIDEESGRPKRGLRGSSARPARARETLDALLPEFLKPDDETRRRAAEARALANGTALEGWTIGVAHPLAPERRIGEIALRDRALATSGSTYQFFRSGGKRYSHIVDPRTGYPTVGVLSTTVLAPTATEADALSTAFFVLGFEKTAEYCRTRPEISALLALERESGEGCDLRAINLGPDVFRPV